MAQFPQFGSSNRKVRDGRDVISGSPAEDCVVLTSGTTAFSDDENTPDGFTVLADAVVDFTTLAGTVLSNISVPAGVTVGVIITSITVDSGTVLVYKP